MNYKSIKNINMQGLRIVFLSLISLVLLAACSSNYAKTQEENSLAYFETAKGNQVALNTYDSLKLGIKNSPHYTLATWNIQHLGQSKTDEDMVFMAEVLRDFDIVAIQEVVAKHPAGAQKVAQLADELNRKGAKWDYRISNPTNSPSGYISERYAFLWKTSKMDLVGRAYLDKDLETQINREPYIAKFKLKKENQTFFVVNVHSRTHKDQPELEIRYFKDYPSRLESNHIILEGDFNLNEQHAVWDELYQQGFESAVKNARTTLKHACNSGNYLSHPIDNIYFSKEFSRVSSGVVDYIEHCENLEAARKISDHLPVFLEFNLEANY